MDREFFMNAGIPPQLQYDYPFTSSMPTWQSLSTSMEIQANQSPDCFLSTPPTNDEFGSALSSMVSSPAASNSVMSNDNFMMRELIGKLGNICNSSDIPPYISNGNCSTNNSCYSTPLSSPPKMPMSILPSLGNSIGLSSNLPAMPGDPGFAERAARFSSFGSRSFNGRTTTNQSALHNNPKEPRSSSNLGAGNGKLHRVSSTPSLKAARNHGENYNNCMIEEKLARNSMNDQGEFSNSRENSTISGQNQVAEIGSSRKRKAAASKAKGKQPASQSQTPTNSNIVGENGGDQKAKRSRPEDSDGKEIDEAKTEENREDDDRKKQNQKPAEPPKDYIHVRARRGQATDSHSLAERVRREKISERMKLLQDLVPGCNKVTGKALMLDEIINYVQSLQRQVEFLSMKLSTVNPRQEMSRGNFFSKDAIQPNSSMAHPMYPIDSLTSTIYGQSQPQQTPTQNPLQDCVTTAGATSSSAPSPMDTLNPTINRNNHALHVPSIDAFSNCLPQVSSLCEGDLQSIMQMGFGQIENGFEAKSLHGTNSTPMKIEFLATNHLS